MIGKILALGLLVEVKAVVSSVLFSLEFLGSSNGIYKALFTLFSNKSIGYFVISMIVLLWQPLSFCVIFFSNSADYCSQQNGMFLKQLRGKFDVRTHIFLNR